MTIESKIQEVVAPRNDLERAIVADPEFVLGAGYGKPRRGHPEGEVINHVGEVLGNVERHAGTDLYDRLRLIAIVHDTFKYKVDKDRPREGENHHATIARRFAERYIDDIGVLEVIELHDEAYNAWVGGDRNGKWEKAEARAKRLLDRLGDNLRLFAAFYECDNETGDKEQGNVYWFKNIVLANTGA